MNLIVPCDNSRDAHIHTSLSKKKAKKYTAERKSRDINLLQGKSKIIN